MLDVILALIPALGAATYFFGLTVLLPLTFAVLGALAGEYGMRVLVLGRDNRLAEAPSFGKPIHAYDPLSRGALAYTHLALELIAREEGGQVGAFDQAHEESARPTLRVLSGGGVA